MKRSYVSSEDIDEYLSNDVLLLALDIIDREVSFIGRKQMKIDIDVEIPEGYEATGEYRVAQLNEYYLNMDNNTATHILTRPSNGNRIILRKKPLTGQAWIDSLPNYAAFLYKDNNCIFQKRGWYICSVLDDNVRMYSDFSNETCKIVYSPGDK